MGRSREAEPLPPTSCLVRRPPSIFLPGVGAPRVSSFSPEGGGADRGTRHTGSGSSGRECEELMSLFSMPAASALPATELLIYNICRPIKREIQFHSYR